MASYFRYIFGGQAGSTTGSNNTAKTHSCSQSAQQEKLTYFYAIPGTTSSTSSSRSSRERSNSQQATSQTTVPSPLRYTTYDSAQRRTSKQSQRRASVQAPVQQPARVPMYRSSSHQAGDRSVGPPHAIFNPTVSFTSTRSASSCSGHGGSTTALPIRPATQRTSSSGSVPRSECRSEPRPALKQNYSWHGGLKSGPQAHVSFLNPNRPTTLHMHPLLAYSRLHHPPISFDVTYSPSLRTVVDRSTRTPIPAHTLAQPATDPPTYSELTLKSDKFPWPVVVKASGSVSGIDTGRHGSGHGSHRSATPITNLDVLYALHNTLATRVKHSEWEALGHGSRAQRKATRAYEKRCTTMGGGWEGGVRRIDYLGSKTRLIGVEVDKSAGAGGAGKLVFGKA